MQALIVDDEPLARQALRAELEVLENVNVVGECANGFDAVKSVAALNPDILFLDIQMPRLDGFEVLELLDREDVAVVFVTAYQEYALKAFDAHAIDYLLKPFSSDRLKRALSKVGRARIGMEEVRELQSRIRGDSPWLSRIVVKDGERVEVVPVEEITHITAEDDYVSINTQCQSLLKHQTLTSLEKRLNPVLFVRIHRSSIVNIEAIRAIEMVCKDKYVAVLKDDVALSISRSGHRRLRKLMQ